MSEEMNTSNVTSEYLDKMAEALISEELERSVLGISELMCLIQYCKEEEQAMMDRSQNGRSAVGYTDRKINEYLSRYFYKRRMFGEYLPEKERDIFHQSENVLISEPGSASRCSTSSEDTRRPVSPAVSSGTSSSLEESTSVTESSDSETPVKKPFLKKLKNALKKLSLQEKSKDSLSVPESTSTESSTSLKTYFPPEEAGEERAHIKEEVNEAAAAAAGEQAADMPLDENAAEKKGEDSSKSENVLISEPGSASRCSTSSEDTRRSASPAVSSCSSSREENTSVTESSDSETPVKKPFHKRLKNAW
uniref:uncharacterized protein LOC109959197 n=1 Tax=Monopterus albus TaxID=43700 RepID=UPI0009B4971F|nr:uncharacterized protein LOC109959197 [Monopterus albus]